jgi:hypothetical protein
MSFVPSDRHFIQSCSFRLGTLWTPQTVMSLWIRNPQHVIIFSNMQGDKHRCFTGSKVLIFIIFLQRHTQLLLQSLWVSVVWLGVITRKMELTSSNTLHIFYSFPIYMLLKQHILQCSRFGKASTVSVAGFSIIRWARKVHVQCMV